MADLLGEVDSNIPAPAPRISRVERSGGRRKARALSPAPEPVPKKTKTLDTRLPSPPPVTFDDDDDDGFIPPVDDDPLHLPDVPMSDPAPSSPAAKVAQRKAHTKKQEPDEDDDEDMMEVAHAGAIKTASVNLASSRPVKRLLKEKPYPTPLSSSPVNAAESAVDSSSLNELTQRLNVVSTSAEPRGIGKLDPKDAIEEDGSLNFFWTDYVEINGSLCLFGKVLNKKTRIFVSCFVKVDNILRKLYFLPRQHRFRHGEETEDEVEMMNVYDEVDELMTKMKVGMYKIKACTRKYAFELPDVPKEAQYMKLFYPYTSTFGVCPHYMLI